MTRAGVGKGVEARPIRRSQLGRQTSDFRNPLAAGIESSGPLRCGGGSELGLQPAGSTPSQIAGDLLPGLNRLFDRARDIENLCVEQPGVARKRIVFDQSAGEREHGAGPSLCQQAARVPQREVLTYPTALRSLTSGEGSFTSHFFDYDVVPGNIQKEIMSGFKLEDED